MASLSLPSGRAFPDQSTLYSCLATGLSKEAPHAVFATVFALSLKFADKQIESTEISGIVVEIMQKECVGVDSRILAVLKEIFVKSLDAYGFAIDLKRKNMASITSGEVLLFPKQDKLFEELQKKLGKKDPTTEQMLVVVANHLGSQGVNKQKLGMEVVGIIARANDQGIALKGPAQYTLMNEIVEKLKDIALMSCKAAPVKK